MYVSFRCRARQNHTDMKYDLLNGYSNDEKSFYLAIDDLICSMQESDIASLATKEIKILQMYHVRRKSAVFT